MNPRFHPLWHLAPYPLGFALSGPQSGSPCGPPSLPFSSLVPGLDLLAPLSSCAFTAPQTLCLSGSLATFLPLSFPNAPLTLWPLSLCSSGATASISMPFCLSPSLVLCLYVPLSTPKDFLRGPHLPPHSVGNLREVCLNQFNKSRTESCPRPALQTPARVRFSGPCLPLDAHPPVLPHTQPGVSLHPAILMGWSLDIRSCWWPIRQARAVDLCSGGWAESWFGEEGGLGSFPAPTGPLCLGLYQARMGVLCLELCQCAVANARPSVSPLGAMAGMEDISGHVTRTGGARPSYQTAEPRFEPRSGCL